MKTDFLVVGAGQAGRRAVQTLRSLSPQARITLIGDEPELPYDRPILSKEALFDAAQEDKAFVEDRAFYQNLNVDLRIGCTVTDIDAQAQVVHLKQGGQLAYEKLMLATGSRVRPFPGQLGEGVEPLYLRTLADARVLRSRLKAGKHLVVLGGGFIGLEVAATARKLGCEVTVVEPASWLLQRMMPRSIGDHVYGIHQAAGVRICLETLPAEIMRVGQRTIIKTDQGDIEADEVVVGIGALPNVELALAAGLQVENGIIVDQHGQTSDPAIFAAGDVTCHFNPVLGRHVRVESWQVAEAQSVVAATTMGGGEAVYQQMPWLWSDQYDLNLQTLGLFSGVSPLIQRGDPASGAFSIIELDGENRLQAVATVNQGKDMAVFKRLASTGKGYEPKALADERVVLRSLLA